MLEHYREVRESERLSEGIGELERLRTQDILRRFLPKPGARILDVGGGAGVHALWLAREGYEVHLIEPVPHHVEQAREASRAQHGHPIPSSSAGDARQIAWADQSVDAGLFLGPLITSYIVRSLEGTAGSTPSSPPARQTFLQPQYPDPDPCSTA